MEKQSVDEIHAPKDNAEILLMAPGRVVVFHVRVRKLNYSHDSLPKFIYPLTSYVCGLIIRVIRYFTNVPKPCSTENLLFLDLMSAKLFNYSHHRWIDYVRVTLYLCFKTSPRVKPFVWKRIWFAWKWTSWRSVFPYEWGSHEDSFWHRGKRELGNGLLVRPILLALNLGPVYANEGVFAYFPER